MGVPKFYRWISERYPNMSRVISDDQIPDFDNFYLDMNGIIHQCSHINEDNCETIVTEEEIFRNIFHYIDFLFRMIKPKKVFFMAIDGVAPRAKMNQQRARRFRAGKDRTRKLKILAEKTNRTFEETAAQHFDTNAITPGTQFMANLDEQLRYFIHVKLTTDPLWENVDVHLSGHLTPGEGEHKIMEFIRYTRSQAGYNVNTRHCLYGLDADLIMLGLVTHEMHFALLREEVKYGSKKISKILAPEEINWHLLHTSLLRDYIDLEFHSLREKLQFPYDLDRIVDDWILMAYLVGNDFIPHLPHVHINEEALSILWDVYKVVLPTLDGYLNESGDLNLPRFEVYLTELGKLDQQRYANENDSFKHLAKLNRRKKYPSKSKSQSESDGFDLAVLEKLPADGKQEPKSPEIASLSDDNDLSSSNSTGEDESDHENEKKKSSLKNLDEYDLDKLPLIEAEFRQHKNHYYLDKMQLNITSMGELQVYVNEYIEAIQWILKYYYQGCPSWSWFYPRHYAPYLSDLKNFKDLNTQLNKGTSFKPFEQLLSVLPPTSRQLLPACLQSLMTDPQSPLVQFYPEDFQLDQNEKKQDWEAIVLLPFIDEELLLNTITKSYPQLNPSEQIRNQHIPSLCFRTRDNLQAVGDALKANPYFPPIKETRAGCREFSTAYENFTVDQIKFGRFDEKEMLIFPKFPTLNVLPYRYAFKSNAVNLFESRSRTTTLVLSLTHQPDRDLISYNDQWNPKGENPSPPFEIKKTQPLIERYLGKRVFVNWPHIQYGIVCAISDYRKIYLWADIPGQPYFYSEPVDPDTNLDFRNFTQSPVYVCNQPFEMPNESNSKKKTIWQTIPLSERDAEMEYFKAVNLNRSYETRQGVSIGPIPLLLYVSPLIGHRTVCSSKSDECQTNLCFSNQTLAYPLQTTLFQIPNYQSPADRMPRTIADYLKINDPIFGLQLPFYSSLSYIQEIKHDKNSGQLSLACRLDSNDQVKQPDVISSAQKLQQHQLRYYTAQQIADQLKTIPSVVAKLTGNVNVLGSKSKRKRPNPTNVGLSWKMNKPVKQLYGYTRKIEQIWYYSEAVMPILSEYMTKFPEIVEELTKKPKEDNYYEQNIWPDKKPRHELQEIRKWIKSLPTYPIPLTDALWEVLDAPVINEVEKFVKTFYTKQAAKNVEKKAKTISLDPSSIFKADESLGMCNPDSSAQFCLFDRVVSVRLGTGVPLGTQGTVVGIMHGRTNLDTYYEILFDNLPVNSLESILLGKDQQKCRIKVRSYHLLNYSHSLRMRSNDCQTQQSIPSMGYAWEQYPNEQTGRHHQSNRATKPRSAPPVATNERPFFNQETQSKPPRSQPSSHANRPFLPPAPMNTIAFYPVIQGPNQFAPAPQYFQNPAMQYYPISPGIQQLNPMRYTTAATFSAQPMPPAIAVNNAEQQQQASIARQISNPLAVNSTLSYNAQPFQPHQSTPTSPSDQQNL